MKDKLKIIFMGTPEYAVNSLLSVINSGHEVAALFCQPDKPKGRGQKLAPPPVKVIAEKAGIPVYQPPKIRNEETYSLLKELSPDIIIVVAYGKILPKEILEIPPLGCINAHASLLPKYRGAAPINRAVANGEKVTGVTIMKMDEGMDTGPMLLWKEESLYEDDNAETVAERLSKISGELLTEAIGLINEGKTVFVLQDNDKATYAPILKKEDGLVDWTKPAVEIVNLIRGMTPWPSAYSFLKGERIRIFKASAASGDSAGFPSGTVVKFDKNGLEVSTGSGMLSITELQREGKNRVKVSELIQGYKIDTGIVFTNE